MINFVKKYYESRRHISFRTQKINDFFLRANHHVASKYSLVQQLLCKPGALHYHMRNRILKCLRINPGYLNFVCPDYATPTLYPMAAKVDLKIVILGKEYGGKTSLVERYLHDKFGDVPYQAVSRFRYAFCLQPSLTRSFSQTIGAAFGAKTVTLEDGHRLTLGIWVKTGYLACEFLFRFADFRYCMICTGYCRRRTIRSNE